MTEKTGIGRWDIGGLATRALQLIDPELAHGLTIQALKAGLVPAQAAPADVALRVRLWGLDFPNPVGLAAGFDKNAEAPDAMLRLGFGFVEVGSVTPRPQAGNPRPRLFRLSEDRAVINRMGFNNDGLGPVTQRLRRRRGRPGIIGINLGANKDSEDRIADYAAGMRACADLADYVVVNVSSPNTPGLRELQGREALARLLDRVREARDAALPAGAPVPPVLVKIAPDFDDDQLAATASALAELQVDGIVVCNTTVGGRDGLKSRFRDETGGLSGRPLFALSTRCLRRVRELTGGEIPLVGVGGVDSGAAAYAKIRAGASLVQLYSAMVFAGPSLPARIAAELAVLLRRDGFAQVGDAVGADLG